MPLTGGMWTGYQNEEKHKVDAGRDVLIANFCGQSGLTLTTDPDSPANFWKRCAEDYCGVGPHAQWWAGSAQFRTLGQFGWAVNPVHHKDEWLIGEHTYNCANKKYQTEWARRAIAYAKALNYRFGARVKGIFIDSICEDMWSNELRAYYKDDVLVYRAAQTSFLRAVIPMLRAYGLQVAANVAWPESFDWRVIESLDMVFIEHVHAYDLMKNAHELTNLVLRPNRPRLALHVNSPKCERPDVLEDYLRQMLTDHDVIVWQA